MILIRCFSFAKIVNARNKLFVRLLDDYILCNYYNIGIVCMFFSV